MNSEEIKLRKALLRKEMLARRLTISPEQRHVWSSEISRLLISAFPMLNSMTIGMYWPYQGEFDPRFAIRHFRDRGARAALPEVVQRNEVLRFRQWWPGVSMIKGIYDIPVPDGTDIVEPQAFLMPPVGFDGKGYRLGYGGGFYDRTLAALAPGPLTIGLAFEISRVQTIHPQEFDIRMDYVVTELGVFKTQACAT